MTRLLTSMAVAAFLFAVTPNAEAQWNTHIDYVPHTETHIDQVPHGNHFHGVPHTTSHIDAVPHTTFGPPQRTYPIDPGYGQWGVGIVPHTTTHQDRVRHGNHFHSVPHTTTHYDIVPGFGGFPIRGGGGYGHSGGGIFPLIRGR